MKAAGAAANAEKRTMLRRIGVTLILVVLLIQCSHMTLKKRFVILAGLFTLVLFAGFKPISHMQTTNLTGAWQFKEGSDDRVLLFQDGYSSLTAFDKTGKKFMFTNGGPYSINGNNIVRKIEFDSREPANIGKDESLAFSLSGNKLTVTGPDGKRRDFTRVDNGTGSLAGNWRITGRMVDGKMNEMPRRDRKTLKLLSGTRFQWMAINPATKEFFGTGGGTYTFVDGKYTETIEFFSRDNNRVGASLSFDGTVENDKWSHSGKSSQGEPLHEVWTREK